MKYVLNIVCVLACFALFKNANVHANKTDVQNDNIEGVHLKEDNTKQAEQSSDAENVFASEIPDELYKNSEKKFTISVEELKKSFKNDKMPENINIRYPQDVASGSKSESDKDKDEAATIPSDDEGGNKEFYDHIENMSVDDFNEGNSEDDASYGYYSKSYYDDDDDYGSENQSATPSAGDL